MNRRARRARFEVEVPSQAVSVVREKQGVLLGRSNIRPDALSLFTPALSPTPPYLLPSRLRGGRRRVDRRRNVLYGLVPGLTASGRG